MKHTKNAAYIPFLLNLFIGNYEDIDKISLLTVVLLLPSREEKHLVSCVVSSIFVFNVEEICVFVN